MRTRLTAIITIALLALVPAAAIAGGGGGGGETAPCRAYTANEAVDRIVLRDFCIDPITAPIRPGTELTVVNDGEAPHTLTATDGSFDTGTIQPGEQVTLTVDGNGLTPVYCILHATKEGDGMAGSLLLSASTADATAPADPPETAAASFVGSAPLWWLLAGLILGLIARTGWVRLRPGRDDT